MNRRLMTASALAASLGASLAIPGLAPAATPSPFTGATVFGDSLSDAGNLSIYTGLPTIMRYTTNPGLTAGEDVAGFFGLPLTPSLAGGTDYAYGGAGVNTNAPGTPAGVPTITQQVDSYLAANPKLSSTELYTVFGGANDIFYHAQSAGAAQIAAGLVASATVGQTPAQAATTTAVLDALVEQVAGVSTLETQAQASTAVNAAATQEVSLISALQKGGAHYIIVLNLPDIGRTPSAVTDDAEAPGTKAFLSTLSQGFDSTLNAGLATMKVGIIPVNTYALFNEVLANPAEYGFVNSTVPACTTSSSLNCTPQTLAAPNAAADYVFADGVHPTSATHAEFAQVVESEILAPQQISLLAEAPLATLEAERNAVGNELLYDQAASARGLRLFATGGYVRQNISGQSYTPSSHDDDGLITVGGDWTSPTGLTLGAEISGGESSEDVNGQLRHFGVDAVVGSVFGQYLFLDNRAYVSGAGGFGALHFHDIQRAFKIGPAMRIENGDTDGGTSMANLAGGYWFGAPALRVGPFVSATYERVRVDAYGEVSGDSTAMTFGDQTREAMIGEAGLRVQGALPTARAMLRPYAELAYAYDGDARQRDVTAGLTTMNGQFAIPGFSPDRQWGDVQVGLNAEFTPRLTGYVAYQGRVGGRSEDYAGGDLGVKYAF